MNTFDASEILAAVEEHIDALPARKRRKPYDDGAAETENYNGIDPAAVSIRCELTHDDQVTLILLLWELGRAGDEGTRGTICRQIWAMLGLSTELPSYEAALTQRYSAAMRRRNGGAA